MTPGEVYNLVVDLPMNDIPYSETTHVHKDRVRAFGQALERLVPADLRDADLTARLSNLRDGQGFCGSAARAAVRCGADPLVVVTTARLILS